ncbi:MAG: hypothetical protein RL301_598 [Actinomycetota bacterium]
MVKFYRLADVQFLANIRKRTSLWTLIFGFTFAIQVYRWAIADMVIFGILTLILAIESSSISSNWKFNGIQVNQIVAFLITAASGVFIYLSERQDPALGFFFALLALMLLLGIWRRKSGAEKLTNREFGHAIYWSAVAGVLGVWEFLALILSRIVHNDKAFPTISELLLPKLDSNLARLVFLIVWLGVGYYFIEKWDQSE